MCIYIYIYRYAFTSDICGSKRVEFGDGPTFEEKHSLGDPSPTATSENPPWTTSIDSYSESM